jgi:hypothetical protein
MMIINNIKKKHSFFYNKNILFLSIYPIIYIIEYVAILFSSFVTWYIQFNNPLLFTNHIDILHSLTALSVIYHIYNEIKREIFLIKYASQYIKYNTDKYVMSYMLLFIIYTLNIIASYSFLIRYDLYNLNSSINITLHSLVIIPILFKGYSILVDKNYTASVIFFDNIYYTRYTNLINFSSKMEHFNPDKIYVKDVYI